MTDEQVLASKQMRKIAEKNNLLISAIWCANDVLEHYSGYYDDEKKPITYDKAEEMLFDWEKQFQENAIESGYRVINMMLQFEDDE